MPTIQDPDMIITMSRPTPADTAERWDMTNAVQNRDEHTFPDAPTQG